MESPSSINAHFYLLQLNPEAKTITVTYGVKSETDEDRAIQSGSDGATTDWPPRLRDRLDVQRP